MIDKFSWAPGDVEIVPTLTPEENELLAAEVFRRLAMAALATAGLSPTKYLRAVALVMAASRLEDLPAWLRRLLSRLGVR